MARGASCSHRFSAPALVRTEHRVLDKSFADFLFDAAFFIYGVSQIIDMSNTSGLIDKAVVCTALECVAVGMLAIKTLMLQKYTSGGVLAALMLLGIFGANLLIASAGQLFGVIAFVIAGQGANVKRLARICFFVTAVGLLAVLAGSLAGLIPDALFVSDASNGQVSYSSWGFQNPNQLGKLFVLLCVSEVILRFNRLKAIDYLFIVVMAGLSYGLSHSRTSLIGMGVILVFSFLCTRHGVSAQSLARFGKVVLVVACFGSVVLAVIYGSVPLLFQIDEVMSGRLWVAHVSLQGTGISLLGTGLLYDWISIDNAYCRLLLQYGLVPFSIFFVSMWILLTRCEREQSCKPCLFGILAMLMLGISEAYILQIDSNYFLAVFSCVLYSKGICEFCVGELRNAAEEGCLHEAR